MRLLSYKHGRNFSASGVWTLDTIQSKLICFHFLVLHGAKRGQFTPMRSVHKMKLCSLGGLSEFLHTQYLTTFGMTNLIKIWIRFPASLLTWRRILCLQQNQVVVYTFCIAQWGVCTAILQACKKPCYGPAKEILRK